MKYFSLLLIVLFFVGCTEKAQQEKITFTLQGKVENPERKFMLLQQESDIERQESIVIDTVFLDETGAFKTDFEAEPHFYKLLIDEQKSIPLILDKGQIITIEINNDKEIITGSKDTDLLMEYEAFRAASLKRLVTVIRKEIAEESAAKNPNQRKIDSLGRLEIVNYDLHLEELNAFIKENMSSSIALYPTSIRWKGEDNLALYDDLVSKIESKYPNLSVSKKLREKVVRLQQTAIGGKVPNIIMNTKEGKEVSLFSTMKNYTLVEFWASWCGPCRRESPILNKVYEKYNKAGFEIFSVSLDANEKQWLAALKKDHRHWTNVSTLEGFKTPAAYHFSVTALPMNYLIDADGKIIAKNLHGTDLEEMLDELILNVKS